MAYARTVQVLGYRTSAATTDLSSVLPEEIEAEVKEAAEISMGTEVSNCNNSSSYIACCKEQ